MSIDIDLTQDNDPVYCTIIYSAGKFRVSVGYKIFKDLAPNQTVLSEHIPTESLKELKQLLNNIDLDKYEYKPC